MNILTEKPGGERTKDGGRLLAFSEGRFLGTDMPTKLALQYFRSQLESRYWWVIVPTGQGGHDLMSDFVERFYGEGAGFEVLSFPLSALHESASGKLVVAFAFKQLCPPSAMAGWLTSGGYPAAEWVLATQDVHFWSSREDSSLSYMVSELLDRTLLRPNRRQCLSNRSC
jgi:hypothetical protein